MRKSWWILVVALAVAASPALAGDKHHEKCNHDPADCAAKLQQKIAGKAWLGVELDVADDGHYRITRVVPDSPAAAAGLAAGDVLLAMNGEDYTEANKKGLKMAWSEASPGADSVFLIQRGEHKAKHKIALGHVPSNLMAQWVGEHMLQAHVVEPVKVAKK